VSQGAVIGPNRWWPTSGWLDCCLDPDEDASPPGPGEPGPDDDWSGDDGGEGLSFAEEGHAARAHRLLRFATANRQDARRVGEDLAMGNLLSPRHKKLHRAARLVLRDGSASCTRALALAQRLLGLPSRG
jgi:hypothetical protein